MNSEINSYRLGCHVGETRPDAYHVLNLLSLSHTQQMIVDCFEEAASRLTREDIAARTNLKLSSVCRCVRELLDAHRLVVDGARKDPATGENHQLLGLPAHG